MPSGEKIAVLGSGSWGTALANHLAQAGKEVMLWGREQELISAIQHRHENPRYFPGVILHETLSATTDLEEALSASRFIIFGIPSSGYRELARNSAHMIGSDAVVVSTAKGLEEGSHKRLTEVLSEEYGKPGRIAVLSGPSFASEVIQYFPTAVTAASNSEETAAGVASLFHFNQFRVYTMTDVIGVELGGALKNIYALAIGMADGQNMGSNARAALLTRGIAEMQRLIVGLGGEPLTVMGLSGLGDLILTATGDLSRNRRAGILLGQGRTLTETLLEIGQVVEGVTTTKRVAELAAERGVSMPIVELMAQVLDARITMAEGMKLLLTRGPKAEFP